MIEEKRLHVKVYTKGRLHAKAYIFDYGQSYDLFGNIQPEESKRGSSLSWAASNPHALSGVIHNT